MLSTEYGRSSSPRIRLTKLLLPEPVSPSNIFFAYYWMAFIAFFKAPAKRTHRTTQARGGGVLPYMGYIGMCGPKGYGFSAVLVINRVWFLHSSLDIFKKPLFHHYRKENQQRPFTNYVYSNLTLV